MGVDDKTVAAWCAEKSDEYENSAPHATRENPWGVIQHFDVWPFASSGTESSYFGKMPLAVVENLLWAFTEPGDIVVDPFAGGGTTIDWQRRWGAGCGRATRLVLAGDRPGNVTVGVDCQQAENSQRRSADGHRPPRAGRGGDRGGEVGRKARGTGSGTGGATVKSAHAAADRTPTTAT